MIQITITFIAKDREEFIDLISYYMEDKNVYTLTSYLSTFPSITISNAKKGNILKVQTRLRKINASSIYEVLDLALEYVLDAYDLDKKEVLTISPESITYNMEY